MYIEREREREIYFLDEQIFADWERNLFPNINIYMYILPN